MNRRYRAADAVIEVAEGDSGEPVGFRWRRRRYEVRAVLARWVEAMPWWVDRAGGQRWVWRVEAVSRTGDTGVYDLYRVHRGDTRHEWGLAQVID